MKSQDLLAVRLRRLSALPYMAGVLVFSFSAAFAWSLHRREDADAHRAVKVKAQALAALIVNRLGERSRKLSGLTASSLTEPSARIAWEAEALRVIQANTFRSLSWVDSSGAVVAAMPEGSGSDSALDPRLARDRAAVVLAARTTGQVTTSAPIFTTSGVPVAMSAAPMAHGASAIVGESSIPALLHSALDADDDGYSFALFADGRELYAHSRDARALESTWAEDITLGDAGSGWRLRVWPTEGELAWRNSRLPELMLFVGTLFALGLAGTMRLYQTADRRAHALARANRRLEDEINQRELAQEALERSEDQLRQSQKMEAVGRLAGGIAHDFNNLLTAINGYADFLLDDIDRGDSRRDDVREIKKAATRAGALTTQLLAFSRRQIRQPRSLDLNALLTDLERMLRRVIGEDVAIDWRPSKQLGSVKADPSDIEQVLLNLVVNAGDAMPNGGTIAVTTGTEDFAGPTARPGVADGRYIRLRVCDTGMGMDAATKARIFEPFFTTKEAGKGTGLGLSTVYAIVENLRGTIDVQSTLGKGTTFTVYIPQHDEPAELLASGTLTTLAPRGDETVLLVEDEEAVRALASRILERHGYTVLEARNGRDALAVVARHSGAIDLLLTDVVMPEMSGKQLAEALVARDATLRVLFVSGYTDGDISRRGELDRCTAFLQKPFTAGGLLSRVREVLDGRAVAVV
ncbi:MAG: domain S-box protein [Gemmatimonadetes bacterium]|nr:domain S-box protein [Gemmatimonadota bacterium]